MHRGLIERRLMVTCRDCTDFLTTAKHSIEEAAELFSTAGWEQLGGPWRCPDCSRKMRGKIGVPPKKK